MTIETIKPALYVACRVCHKDCLAGDLRDLCCVDCRLHRACGDVRGEIVAFVKKQQRYATSGGRANQEQLERLRRRLFTRILEVISDPRQAAQLADKEYQVALKESPLGRFRVTREDAARLHPGLGKLEVLGLPA